MHRSVFLKWTVLGSVGCGGWLAGVVSEKLKYNTNVKDVLAELIFSDKKSEFKNADDGYGSIYQMPGLPVFGTVSAARPIEEEKGIIPHPGGSGDTAVVPTQKDLRPNRTSQIMKYGFPGLDQVRSFDDFVLSYDRRNRVPFWVFEHLRPENVSRNDAVDRSKCEFFEDGSVNPFFRSQNTDYKGSGFDRGHMAAAGNHRQNQFYCEQTFVLSNIAPQVGKGFNRDSWNTLEKHVRSLTKVYNDVYVCTGPLYLPRKESDGKLYIKYQVLGVNHVAVPTHFFKVVVGEKGNGDLEMESYVMPNQVIDDKTPINVFQVPPETVERAAGLLFFDRISRDKLKKINGKKSTWV